MKPDEVYTLIKSKLAVRDFADRPLPENVMRDILDAGRRSGSSKNTQPWHFVAVRDRDRLAELSKTGDYAGHLAGAALGVFIVAPVPPASGAEEYDFGRTTQNMMLMAHAHGVGSVVAAIYRPDEAAAVLGVPEGYRVAWGISFGYPSEKHHPLKLGGRRERDEVVHRETW